MIDFKKNLGLGLLAIYLIIAGLNMLFRIPFEGMRIIMGILALVAGILLLVGR